MAGVRLNQARSANYQLPEPSHFCTTISRPYPGCNAVENRHSRTARQSWPRSPGCRLTPRLSLFPPRDPTLLLRWNHLQVSTLVPLFQWHGWVSACVLHYRASARPASIWLGAGDRKLTPHHGIITTVLVIAHYDGRPVINGILLPICLMVIIVSTNIYANGIWNAQSLPSTTNITQSQH